MNSKEILEAVDYAYEKHPDFKKTYPKWKYLSFFDIYSENIIVQRENGKIVGVAMYARITDESLEEIISSRIKMKDYASLYSIMKEEGNNIYFIGVVADNMKYVLKGLREIINKYKPETVSWLRDTNGKNKFFITSTKEKSWEISLQTHSA